MKNFKSCIPALVILVLLYALAGTTDYIAQCEIEQARAGATP